MRIELKDVPVMPDGTPRNPNDSYDAVEADGHNVRWRFMPDGSVAVFIRYEPNWQENKLYPWKHIYINPKYDI